MGVISEIRRLLGRNGSGKEIQRVPSRFTVIDIGDGAVAKTIHVEDRYVLAEDGNSPARITAYFYSPEEARIEQVEMDGRLISGTWKLDTLTKRMTFDRRRKGSDNPVRELTSEVFFSEDFTALYAPGVRISFNNR